MTGPAPRTGNGYADGRLLQSEAVRTPAAAIELVSDWQTATALACDWNALLDATASPSISMSWDYVSTWWQTCRDDHKLRILLARDENGRLTGIAPMMIGTGDTLARRAVRQLSFIGAARTPVSQLMDFIVRAGSEREVAHAFTRYILDELSAEWDILHLPFIEQTSVLMTEGLPLARELGCSWQLNGYEPAPFVRLDGNWDDYLASRSRNWRTSLRRAYAKLAREHAVEILHLGRDIALEEALEAFIELHDKRWGEESLALGTRASRAFLRELARKLATQDRLVIVLVRIDGAFAAGCLDFVFRETLVGYQGGWDPAYAHLAIGNIALAEEFKWCFAKDFKVFDFQGGDEAYKQRWMTGMRELANIEIVNPASLRGRLFTKLRTLKHHCQRRGFAGAFGIVRSNPRNEAQPTLDEETAEPGRADL